MDRKDGLDVVGAAVEGYDYTSLAWLVAVLCDQDATDTDRLQFLFEKPDGESVEIGYDRLLVTIRLAERYGILPHLPASWWDRVPYVERIEAKVAEQSATQEPAEPCTEPDLLQQIEMRDRASNTHLMDVCLASLVQCLCIAEQRGYVPRLDPEWEARTTPPGFRKLCKSMRFL